MNILAISSVTLTVQKVEAGDIKEAPFLVNPKIPSQLEDNQN